MRILLGAAAALAMGASAPLQAQPADSAPLSAEALEDRRAMFAWLVGTWRGDHMFGPNSTRAGAQVTFYLEADGTVSARLDKTSEWMDGSEKRLAGMVGQQIIRGISTSNPAPTVWANSAGGGSVINKSDGQWTNLGIIYVDAETGKLSHLGAMSDFSHWVKISGTTAAKPAGTNTGPGPTSPAEGTNAPSTGAGSDGTSTPATRAQPANTVPEEEAPNNKRCDYQFYKILVGDSTKSIVAAFENDVDEVATYDSDMPAARMYPSPVKSATDIPNFLTFDDYTSLRRIEALTTEIVANSGPDSALTNDANQIRLLFLEARRQYDIAAQDAAARRQPCPKFSDISGYQHVAAADKIMARIRNRRDGAVKGTLAETNRLREKMTKQFYSDLADASSIEEKVQKLQDKGYELAKKYLKSVLTGEQIEPEKVEDLTPQLDALRERYAQLEAQGKPISDAQRDKDLKAALKRSGIDYDPAIGRNAVSDGQKKIGSAAFDYAKSLITNPSGNPATGIFGRLSALKGKVSNVQAHAEILNSSKNYYDLLQVEKDVLPLALAVEEDRAYITGLVGRYDIVEQEYALLRSKFENAVSSGGELSETDRSLIRDVRSIATLPCTASQQCRRR
ncbi:MAG: hypothetical protein ABJ239_00245 [Erythrobacter sp.]